MKKDKVLLFKNSNCPKHIMFQGTIIKVDNIICVKRTDRFVEIELDTGNDIRFEFDNSDTANMGINWLADDMGIK